MFLAHSSPADAVNSQSIETTSISEDAMIWIAQFRVPRHLRRRWTGFDLWEKNSELFDSLNWTAALCSCWTKSLHRCSESTGHWSGTVWRTASTLVITCIYLRINCFDDWRSLNKEVLGGRDATVTRRTVPELEFWWTSCFAHFGFCTLDFVFAETRQENSDKTLYFDVPIFVLYTKMWSVKTQNTVRTYLY
jgi:hypothetical protein